MVNGINFSLLFVTRGQLVGQFVKLERDKTNSQLDIICGTNLLHYDLSVGLSSAKVCVHPNQESLTVIMDLLDPLLKLNDSIRVNVLVCSQYC